MRRGRRQSHRPEREHTDLRPFMGGDLPATREAENLIPLPAEHDSAGHRNDLGVRTREGDFGGPWRHC